MIARSLGVLTCVTILSACGGGGGAAFGPVDQAVFDDKEAQLVGKLNALASSSSVRAIGPTSGSARYTGQVGVNLVGSGADSNVVGDMVMTANFQNRDIGGSVSRLISEDQTTGDTAQLGGRLTIDGDYSITGVIEAALTGEIQIPDGDGTLNADVDMIMAGEFLEVFDPSTGPGGPSEGNVVAGTIIGEVTGDVLLRVRGGSFIGENAASPGALSGP